MRGGFGLAFPGIIEPDTERILAVPAGKFDDAGTLDVRGWTKTRLGIPLLVCNDANAALAGEHRFGAARGCRSVVMVTLGTGLGSAAIIDGVPLRGQHGQAGCLGGRLLGNVHGRGCRCGNLGCVETEASTWALPELVRSRPGWSTSALAAEAAPDYGTAFRLAAAGDPAAAEICAHSVRVWAAAIVSLIHAYDPERVVVGGGLMRSAGMILPGLRDYVARHAWTPWGRVEVVPAALGHRAGLLGVADLLTQSLAQNHRP